MNPVLIDLGIIKIYWYSLFIFLALLVGGTLVLVESKRFRIPENFMINLFFWLIPIALLGARLYYVLFNWELYSSNLIDIIKIWEGGLAIHGAIIFGLIFIIIYTKKYKVNTFFILDFIVVGLLIGQAIGRWGNFFNGEAHGPATTLSFLKSLHLPKFIIDGMYINGTYYQPTFLYESIGCLIGFIILLLVRKRKKLILGHLTSIYLIWYGIIRFFIESLRTDSLLFLNLKAAQIVSIIMICVGLLIIILTTFISKYKKYYYEVEHGKIFY